MRTNITAIIEFYIKSSFPFVYMIQAIRFTNSFTILINILGYEMLNTQESFFIITRT